jgi:hypothetical protein
MKPRRVFGRVSDDVSIRGRIESGPQEGVPWAKRTVLISLFKNPCALRGHGGLILRDLRRHIRLQKSQILERSLKGYVCIRQARIKSSSFRAVVRRFPILLR